MNDNSYYKCLSVIDRINDEAMAKFGSGYRFSIALGRNKSWWNVRYSAATFPRLKNLNTYARLFDVSVRYLLIGGKREKYIPVTVDCQEIYKKYKSQKCSVDVCKKYAPIMFHVKQGHDVNLGTLFDLAEIFKVPVYELGFIKSQNFSAK